MDVVHRRDAKFASVGVQVTFEKDSPQSSPTWIDKNVQEEYADMSGHTCWKRLYIRTKFHICTCLKSQVFLLLVLLLLFITVVIIQPHPTGRRYAIFRDIKDVQKEEIQEEQTAVRKMVPRKPRRKHIFGHEKKNWRKSKKHKQEILSNKSLQSLYVAYNIKSSNTENTFTFRNVCVEVMKSQEKDKPVNKIVIYTNSTTELPKWLRNMWALEIKHSSIPSGHILKKKAPAYFIKSPSSGQIFYFWRDVYVPLYHSLNITNRLKIKPNMLILPKKTPQWDSFLPFMKTLPFTAPLGTVISDISPNTCFSHGVFGAGKGNSSQWMSASKYLKKYLKIKKITCKHKTVTLMALSQTKSIKNLALMYNATLGAGFTNIVKIADDTLSLRSLLSTAQCTDVLVGVQFTSMAFLPFLKPGTKVIEIYWKPSKPVLYSINKKYKLGLVIQPLKVDQLQLNATAYSKTCNDGKHLTEEDRTRLQKRPRQDICSDVRHFAAATVDVAKYLTLLQKEAGTSADVVKMTKIR